MKEKITIIIPNYNGKHFMEPCLDSLQKQKYMNFKILVIDNNSSDGSVNYLREKHPEIEIISLDQNYGFSKAVNVGIQHSTTPYVILLNNDTTVDPGFTQELLNAIRKSPQIFSVSSKMIQMHHPEFIDSAGDFYTILGWGFGKGKDHSVNTNNRPVRVFSACAGAAIYRRSVFEQIGYFDERHFAYLEDVDIGYRARIYGYHNLYCPTALVYHVGSGTSGSKYNAFKVKLSARNNVYLIYKNMPMPQIILNFLPLLTGTIIKYLFFIKSGFAKEYKEGIQEAFSKLSEQKKVPFHIRNLPHYICIELDLIRYTFVYFKEWTSKTSSIKK